MAQVAAGSSIPLSLRPPTHKNQNPQTESFQYLFDHIKTRYGGFQHVSEELLRQEIREQKEQQNEDTLASLVTPHQDNDEDPEETVEEHRSRIYKARQEMIDFTHEAQQEALLTLDFLSLLLRKDLPNAANSTLSPYVKTSHPIGSFASSQLPPTRPTPAQEEQNKKVAVGWTLQHLDSAADRLLGAAQRLEKDMQKEANYWEQILKVKEGRWSLCRIPRDPHTIGVRYGFSEALPYFHNQGLAALRSDARGNVQLDRGAAKEHNILRVEAIRDGATTSSQDSIPGESAVQLEDTIRAASSSLFDEELFHLLTLEARSLLAFGVTLDSSIIRVPISDTPPTSLRISLSSSTSDRVQQDLSSTTNEADALVLALRILLTQTYRNRFQRRSRPPPPISTNPMPEPTPHILKPVLAYMRHSHVVQTLSTDLARYFSILKHSGFEASRSITMKTDEGERQERNPQAHKSPTAMEKLVQALSSPLSTVLTLDLRLPPNDESLTTSQDGITLLIHTNLTASPYGTNCSLSLLPNLPHTSVQPPKGADHDPRLDPASSATHKSEYAIHVTSTSTSTARQHLTSSLTALRKAFQNLVAQRIAHTLAAAHADVLEVQSVRGQAVLVRKSHEPKGAVVDDGSQKPNDGAELDQGDDVAATNTNKAQAAGAGLVPLLQPRRLSLVNLTSAGPVIIGSWSEGGFHEKSEGEGEGEDERLDAGDAESEAASAASSAPKKRPKTPLDCAREVFKLRDGI